MAHHHLSAAVAIGIVATLAGCAPTTTPAASGDPATAAAATSGFDEGRSGRYHSARFELSLVLPGGKEWTVDDHRGPELVATHAPTSSRLTLRVFELNELVNRQRCELEARARSLVPAKLSLLDESDEGGPPDFDTHVVVGLAPPPASADKPPITGHVLAFAARVRRCLVFDFSATVPAGAEATLGDRLAVGTTRILPTVQLDSSAPVRSPRR